MKNKSFAVGAFLAMFGPLLWGVSGTVGQFLFQQCEVSPEWLVTVRLLISGFLLLLISSKGSKGIFEIWKNKTDAISLLIFSIFGMMAVQYTYFMAIKFSNAATATVLQYLGPVLIMIYLALRNKKLPTAMEFIAIFCAVFGTFLLATHGNIKALSISGQALFWGLTSAVAMAIYTVQPGKLLEKWGSSVTAGWGMFIGGVVLSFIRAPWQVSGVWNAKAIAAIIFIVLFGTLIAFYSYLEGVKSIGPTTASMLASVEPLSAAFFSIIWLKVSFGMMDIGGFCFIILTIFLLAYRPKERAC